MIIKLIDTQDASNTLLRDLIKDKVKLNLYTEIFPLPFRTKLSLLHKLKYNKSLNNPRYVWIESTNECNLQCVMCPHSGGLKRKKMKMEMDAFVSIIDQISGFRPTLFLHHTGEPLLNKNLCEMIEYAKKRGCWVGIYTNATLLTEEMSIHILKTSLDFITFSFDGCSPEVYEKIRVGANFERVKSQIETFLRLRYQMRRGKPYTQIEILLMKETYQHISDFITYWQTKAVHRVGIKPVTTWHGLVDDRSVVRWPNYGCRPCRDVFYKCAILVDGTVVPCCTDNEGRLPLGNVFVQPFKEIWNGNFYNQLRMQHLYNTIPKDSICYKCIFHRCWSRREQIFYLIFNNIFFPKIKFCNYQKRF